MGRASRAKQTRRAQPEPKAAAKPRTARTRTKKASTKHTRAPFKIVYQLVVAKRDDKGEIVGETPALRQVGEGQFAPQEFVLYVSEFDDLRQKITEAMPQVVELLDLIEG